MRGGGCASTALTHWHGRRWVRTRCSEPRLGHLDEELTPPLQIACLGLTAFRSAVSDDVVVQKAPRRRSPSRAVRPHLSCQSSLFALTCVKLEACRVDEVRRYQHLAPGASVRPAAGNHWTSPRARATALLCSSPRSTRAAAPCSRFMALRRAPALRSRYISAPTRARVSCDETASSSGTRPGGYTRFGTHSSN